jgi:signal transduction histidine kinase
MLSRLKIAWRIDLILILAAVGMLICASIALFASHAQMLEDRRVQLRHLLDMALSIARADMRAAGGPNTEAGQKAFFSALISAQFGEAAEANYLFAFDYDGVTKILNKPALIGTNRMNIVDPNGVKMVPEFIKIAKSPAGSGFIEYAYEKGVGGPTMPKMSFLRDVPEMGWVLGVGIYLDDLHAFFRRRLVVEAEWFALALLAITLLCYGISRSITRPLSNLTKKIKSLARGDTTFALAGADDKSELGDLAAAVDVLRANAIERQALHEKVREQTTLLVEQKEKAEQAVKAKTEFLSNMSHELRTPMHAVLGYSEIGLTAADESDAQRTRKSFENIQRSGKRLLNLLNDLLSLAKLDAGKVELKQERGDLREVVDHTLIELAPLIKKKNLQICRELGAHAEAVFDKNHITQVLINIMSNAIKFSKEESKIVIRIYEETLPGREPAIGCRVIDEGPGIPTGELEAVFDKFVQSSKTKSGAGGTGLGLAICWKIVEAHHGRIWAENGAPKGAVFTFVIPRGCVALPPDENGQSPAACKPFPSATAADACA